MQRDYQTPTQVDTLVWELNEEHTARLVWEQDPWSGNETKCMYTGQKIALFPDKNAALIFGF